MQLRNNFHKTVPNKCTVHKVHLGMKNVFNRLAGYR